MQNLSDYLYLIPIALGAILGLKSFTLKWPWPFRIIAVFLWCTLAVETFAIAWKLKLYHTAYWSYLQDNLWIYNAFIPVRHLFLLSFFYAILASPLTKRLIILSVIPFLCFAIVDYFFIQTPHEINSYTFSLANIITVLLSLNFFYQILKDKEIITLSASPQFWIVLGTFMYCSGTLPLFLFLNYLNKRPAIADSYFRINDALNILMYTLYLISFLCKPHSLKSRQ